MTFIKLVNDKTDAEGAAYFYLLGDELMNFSVYIKVSFKTLAQKPHIVFLVISKNCSLINFKIVCKCVYISSGIR